jgi:phosphate-selective porin OprO/OprP
VIDALALIVELTCANVHACSPGNALLVRPYASAQEPKKTGKPKKAKKPKVDKPAPDDVIDDDGVIDAPAQPTDVVEKPGPFVWRQHPSLRFGKAVRLDFEAKFQEDGRSSYPGGLANAGLNPWELHRNRVGVKGSIGKHIDFEVERELTEKELTERDVLVGLTPKSQWKDVDVNVDYVKNAQIQVGKFKIPFGLDELTGVTHNDFVYRSLGANYLAPARDVGGMVHGSFLKHGLQYAAGVFAHDGDNGRSKKIEGGNETVAGRVTLRPLRRVSPALDALEIGTAVALTALSDDSFRPNGLRGRSVITQDTFFKPVYVKGRRSRMEGDVDLTIGPASVRAEYTQVRDTRRNQSFTDEDLPDARYRSWYVAATWLLTGDRKRRPVRPKSDLFDGGIGAVELVGRVERLWFDSVDGTDEPFANSRAENILPVGDRAATMGVNWTLNRFVKLQFNVIRERIDDADRNPVANGAAFWSRVVRLQFVL